MFVFITILSDNFETLTYFYPTWQDPRCCRRTGHLPRWLLDRLLWKKREKLRMWGLIFKSVKNPCAQLCSIKTHKLQCKYQVFPYRHIIHCKPLIEGDTCSSIACDLIIFLQPSLKLYTCSSISKPLDLFIYTRYVYMHTRIYGKLKQ